MVLHQPFEPAAFIRLLTELSFNGICASFHACRECSLKFVDTLLICGLCLRFLLLLLLRSGLCRLLLGCFVGSSLLCAPHHSPGSGSSGCSFACLMVSHRSDSRPSGGALGSSFYTTAFCLLGIVRGSLLLCFLLLLGLCSGWRSLRVNSRLLFG